MTDASEPHQVASRATLEALEYPALLELVAAGARTDLGAERVRALRPATAIRELERRRAELSEVARLGVDGALVPSLGEPIAPLVARLTSDRAPLGGIEIVLVARLLSAAADAARRIERADPPCPALAARVVDLGDVTPLVAEIGRVLDAKGRVKDDASPRLVQLAKETREARTRIYSRLERVRSAHADLFAEETTPLRGGRVLLVLSAGARGKVPGLVHGRSGSGQSFYFEPLDVVEENNALQGASEAQEEERQRLLQGLRAALARELPLVERLTELVARLDRCEAALDFAALCGARLAGVAPAGVVRLVGARHPLLEPRLAPRRERLLGHAGHTGAIEPLALALGGFAEESHADAEPGAKIARLLVVTGPNAGGKTVALKTLGLLALAAQAGLPIPCAAGSELPLFDAIVATVGDEQDLLEERSTFSGRLLRLAEAWRGAGATSLTLVDELGSGTDPEEGAALAVALVERLIEAGGVGVVTTHLTPVALAALERDGAGCAAMEFDPESGRPTFRLRPGPPGASEAIALARRLGLPAEWIARAEALVAPGHRELRRTLAELEATRAELARAAAEAEREGAEARAEANRLARERATLEAERRTVGERARQELRVFREKVTGELAKQEERLRAEFAAGRRRGLASEAAARLFDQAPAISPEEPPPIELPLAVGAAVHHRGLGWSGTVERIDGEKVRVVVGGKHLSAARSELVALAAPATRVATEKRAASSGDAATDAAPELMLLGFTVEDALDAVDDFLDRALRAERPQVRIVHGHGTGRLRDAIRAHLKKHAAVATQRPGAPNEGGNGATVVELG